MTEAIINVTRDPADNLNLKLPMNWHMPARMAGHAGPAGSGPATGMQAQCQWNNYTAQRTLTVLVTRAVPGHCPAGTLGDHDHDAQSDTVNMMIMTQ